MMCWETGPPFLAACFAELAEAVRPCVVHHLSPTYIRMAHHKPDIQKLGGFVKVCGVGVFAEMKLGFSVPNEDDNKFRQLSASAGLGSRVRGMTVEFPGLPTATLRIQAKLYGRSRQYINGPK